MQSGDTLDRLTHGIYSSDDKDDSTGRSEHAFKLVLGTTDIQRKLRDAYKEERVSSRDRDVYPEAKEKNIITASDCELFNEDQ